MTILPKGRQARYGKTEKIIVALMVAIETQQGRAEKMQARAEAKQGRASNVQARAEAEQGCASKMQARADAEQGCASYG